MNTELLFKPFKAGNLTLPNRIVMAPMTRNFSPQGIPGPDVAMYYRRRAENAVGLIITEGTAINHPVAVEHTSIPNFYGEGLKGWAKVVEEVHAVGGKIIPQLWHVGTARQIGADNQPNPEALPVGPSGISPAGEKVVEPLTETEIADIIAAYAQAAADAQRVGFDGIELHGAHGYLIDQFFWDKTNKRTDQYGGNLVQRTRFAVEVIEACRRAVGPDFPIILRFSQWKMYHYEEKLAQTPQELEQFLAPLVKAGVDVFHCSSRRFWEPEFEGSDLNLAAWTKKVTGKPVITVGSIGLEKAFLSDFEKNNNRQTEQSSSVEARLEQLVGQVEREEADLVAVGRALLVDPAFAVKLRDQQIEEIIPYSDEVLKTLN
ncbi:NADH:flavin oxidoreductase [Paenibacillus polymyxa]|uniref:NADH:flavin oxidoreductase n=1 Tax=Paenibacillus polymyxa TaxID=1406 RepID=UPI002AB473A9|nr:NADH:flavin oxidoreductase [Paenibacillus polymyxa]MDY8095451.1 NADH:flavin oxidoreductase [Paenibacillus polymyxa]